MTKFRFHRGGFDESMLTTVHVKDRDGLIEILRDYYGHLQDKDVTVEPYGGIDARNGWDTYIVSIKGEAVGMTDGPL